MPRKKKVRCWRYTAGKKPHQFTVEERVPGGVIYERVYDPSLTTTVRGKTRRGGQVRHSLGHADREAAMKYAEQEAAKLRAGAAALEGRPTLAGVLSLYLIHRTPTKKAAETKKDDRRHAQFWTRLYGDRLVAELGDTEWNEATRLRATGARDARGNPVAEKDRRPVGPRGVDATLVFIIAVLNWAMGYKVRGRQLITANPFGAPAPGVRRTLERPKNLAPKRPIATYDRFLKVRAKAEQVLMAAREKDPGAVLVEVGRAKFKHGEGPVKLWMRPSYLPELLDLVEATGRRISAICQLWYSDFIREGGQVTKIRWRPFKGAAEKIVPLNAEGRAAVARILAKRPGVGDVWVFPSPRKPSQPIARQLARDWLQKAETLAEVPHLEGGAFHPYRRKWATERKHLPDADVMEAGGWTDERSLKQSYQQADSETVLAVVNEPRKLVEKKA